jgi:hypothetical protein
MELLVERQVADGIGCEDAPHLALAILQGLDQLLVDLGIGQLQRLRLQHQPQPVDIKGLGQRDGRDTGSLVPHRLDEALGLEQAQRLPDRYQADRVAIPEALQLELHARPELSAQDGGPDPPVGNVDSRDQLQRLRGSEARLAASGGPGAARDRAFCRLIRQGFSRIHVSILGHRSYRPAPDTTLKGPSADARIL